MIAAAGGGEANCDPKDVARMVEDYVIAGKNKKHTHKEDASSRQTFTIHNKTTSYPAGRTHQKDKKNIITINAKPR